MRLIKIGLGNIDATVGAFHSNAEKAAKVADAMARAGCAVGCFPELVINGYAPEDLAQWRGFVARGLEALDAFAEKTADFPTVFAFGVAAPLNGHIYNCAAVVYRGKVLGFVPKEKLPTYGVFYESRIFSAGRPGMSGVIGNYPFGDLIFRFPFGTMAVEVCEDIWSPDGPMCRRAYSGAELIVNISASPFRSGVSETRRGMIATRAADNAATVAYVNLVGGNDSLVFDGGGFVNQCGRLILEAERFREGIATVVVDLDRTDRHRKENTTWRADAACYLAANAPVAALQCAGPRADNSLPYPAPKSRSFFMPDNDGERAAYFEELAEAMISGLGAYFEKTGVFKNVAIALSGGRDSVLTLIVAWLYAGRKFRELDGKARARAIKGFIRCLSMPSRYNSRATRSAAREICAELGVDFREVPIAREALVAEAELRKMLGKNEKPTPLTLQNLQARIRGERMWNFANATGALWLQTGNMSEKAVGYTTVGGDMMGGYSLIGNLPKTVVIELLRYLAEKHGVVSARKSLAIESSAELAENQSDEAELMPFEVLDACYFLFAGEKMMPEEVFKVLRDVFGGCYEAARLKDWTGKFVRLFRRSIFKWVQAPQAAHLGSLDLDRERALQLPVVQSEEWLELEKLDELPRE